MTRPRSDPPFRRETDTIPPMRAYLEGKGFRVYPNVDGNDYFDLVARRGRELGLVELKRSLAGPAFGQALRRRAWGDWVGVALGSGPGARRLATERNGRLSSVVGIWWVHGETVELVRAPTVVPTANVPRRERVQLHAWLDAIDRGWIPPGTRMEGLGGTLRRLSQGRAYREWTVEEAADGPVRQR